jgi:hypothetical protein
MNRDVADPIADHLLTAYSETAIFSRDFKNRFGQPPTVMAKVHHLLSIVQARANRDDRYLLGSDYSEYGRVELTESSTGTIWLLRGSASVSIERHHLQEASLFDATHYIASDVQLLVHKFHDQGLDLSVAGTQYVEGKKRLTATGAPTFIGTWTFLDTASDAQFDQGRNDSFEELGAMDELGENGEL